MVTYTTAARVASLLNLTENGSRLIFSSSTLPTDTEVNSLIEECEEIIDSKVNTSWRTNVSVTDEMHDYQERVGYAYDRLYHIIKLDNPPVTDLDSASGDKLEVWDGSAWIDWLTTKTAGQSPEDEDFYVDTSRGWIYIHNSFPPVGGNRFRITYRYGEGTVPKDIQHACTLLVGIKILENYRQYIIKAEGENDPSFLDLARKWKRDIDDILAQRENDFIYFI